jgi:hypothetical protein
VPTLIRVSTPVAPAATRALDERSRGRVRRLLAGGPTGNERLTGTVAALLLVLLAAEGVTVLRVRQLFTPHVFIGLLLIPPVLVKLASTGYRFARYYTRNADYRTKGPPQLPLRVLAPIVVVSTVAVFATGVALIVAGPSSRDTLLTLHKGSFIVWLGATGIHVLAYLPRIPALTRADFAARAGAARLGGRGGRWLVIATALLAGVVLAFALLPLAGSWPTHIGDFGR